MENNQTLELEKLIWSEQAMMELLGVSKKQLARLRREKDFPCIHLTRNIILYLSDEVLDFVQEVRKRR